MNLLEGNTWSISGLVIKILLVIIVESPIINSLCTKKKYVILKKSSNNFSGSRFAIMIYTNIQDNQE